MEANSVMIIQTINEIDYKMASSYDFSFLKKYGKVFKVFDDQDSGNICFGIEGENEKLFIKFAGAPTAEYKGDTVDAINRLKATIPIYQSVHQTSLIKFVGAEEIGNGLAMIFRWSDGECMGRMYPESHQKVMDLSVEEKIGIFRDISAFLIDVFKQGYIAIDFYDGSIMYDLKNKITTICDIDFFRESPSQNDMGQMWGSSRFMSPEEYELGATLDEITNVFTLGQMGFSLFTDSNRDITAWPLSEDSYYVLMKAINTERNKRYQSINDFAEDWNRAITLQ
jgi:serine/threonine-protein kinase